MILSNPHSRCASCPLNRRHFLARAGGVVAGTLALPAWALAAEATKPTRVRIIFSLHGEKQDRPDWPNKGFDFRPAMERIEKQLSRRCHGFQFSTSRAAGDQDAQKILAEDKAAGNIDGYLVCQMNCWNRVVQTVATSGKPVLYADFQFGGSGGFLVYSAGFIRSLAPNVGFIASSRIEDLAEAVNCIKAAQDSTGAASFSALVAEVRKARTPAAGHLYAKPDDLKCLSSEECVAQLKSKKILAIRDQKQATGDAVMGVKVDYLPFADLNEAWQAADKDEARAVANQWVKSARRVEGVSRETLESSAAMYLAQKTLLRRHDAVGITINCLGGFYGGHIHAYPCLGFHQLLNEGLIGGCECDVRSAVTMVVGTTLTQGRPGYISDPVIDTSKRQIIYAHCVASNKAFGPKGRSNPFEILTHSEDRQGASVRSCLPVGYLVTTIECDGAKKEILLHRAKTMANDPDDRACRTKLCAEPAGDIEKLFGMWDQWGWHRVTFYGDLKKPIYALAEATGWKVVEEA